MSKYSFRCLVIFFLLTFISLHSQTRLKKIAILPFSSNGIDEVSVQTAESILRLEISRLSSMDIISEKRIKEAVSDVDCSDEECALKTGRTLEASRVIGTKLS